MVDKRDCSFCGRPSEPGTGMLFVKRDGSRLWFDSHKCKQNALKLKRVARTVKWTDHYVKGGHTVEVGQEKKKA
jgi:large subunit ribosomal protein L24e